ncbi:hypothetical protein EXY28_19965 [Burkholderia pseudomallei]|nr:hypothetical protein EXY28_19965 [Burkholderia pseudomallei]
MNPRAAAHSSRSPVHATARSPARTRSSRRAPAAPAAPAPSAVAARARGVHAVAGKSPASGEGRHGAAPRANGATSPPLARIVRGAPLPGTAVVHAASRAKAETFPAHATPVVFQSQPVQWLARFGTKLIEMAGARAAARRETPP